MQFSLRCTRQTESLTYDKLVAVILEFPLLMIALTFLSSVVLRLGGRWIFESLMQLMKQRTMSNICTHLRSAVTPCTVVTLWVNDFYPLSRLMTPFFYGPHPEHMEVPRLGVELELHLLAYTTATATPDPGCIYDLHHSSWQCQILNPPIKVRDQTHILMDTSGVRYHWATMGTPNDH